MPQAKRSNGCNIDFDGQVLMPSGRHNMCHTVCFWMQQITGVSTYVLQVQLSQAQEGDCLHNMYTAATIQLFAVLLPS